MTEFLPSWDDMSEYFPLIFVSKFSVWSALLFLDIHIYFKAVSWSVTQIRFWILLTASCNLKKPSEQGYAMVKLEGWPVARSALCSTKLPVKNQHLRRGSVLPRRGHRFNPWSGTKTLHSMWCLAPHPQKRPSNWGSRGSPWTTPILSTGLGRGEQAGGCEGKGLSHAGVACICPLPGLAPLASPACRGPWCGFRVSVLLILNTGRVWGVWVPDQAGAGQAGQVPWSLGDTVNIPPQISGVDRSSQCRQPSLGSRAGVWWSGTSYIFSSTSASMEF